MVALSLSSSNFATAFLGKKLPLQGNARELTAYCSVSRSIKCAVDTPYGGNIQKFPRISVWDTYRRLGVSYDASEEELWGSRNFLLQQYAGHERSEEAIEAAFEKILMASFRQRKKTKINLKSRLKKKVEESPPWVQNSLNYFDYPQKIVSFCLHGGLEYHKF